MDSSYPNLGFTSSRIRVWVMGSRASHAEKKRFLALLRRMRMEAGMRQTDLARQLGEPQSFVSKYESGERRLDVLELRRICAVLDFPLVEFVRRLERDDR